MQLETEERTSQIQRQRTRAHLPPFPSHLPEDLTHVSHEDGAPLHTRERQRKHMGFIHRFNE